MLGSKALSGNVRVRVARVNKMAGTPVRSTIAKRAHSQRTSVRVFNLFDFFKPKDAGPSSSAKAAELTEELFELVGSNKASASDVDDLVKQLQPFGIKNPVRSKLLFGEYKLVYSSKPAAGSPVQILEEPDVIREVSEFKSFGLLPGTSTQSGEVNGLSNDTYEEVFDTLEVKSALSSDKRNVDITRTVTVLYLDGDLRITRTKAQNDSGEGVLAVYQRIEAEEEEEPEERKQGTGMVFFGGAPKEGIATISEREVLKKMAAEAAKGKSNVRMPANLPASPAAALAARAGTAKIGVTPPAKGTVQVDAKAAKEKADAERRAQADKSAAIKELLADLGDDLKEAQAEARQAAKEAKDVERGNTAVLKQVSAARSQLSRAAEDVQEVEEALAKAGLARATAEAALKEALSGVSAAQSRVKAIRK